MDVTTPAEADCMLPTAIPTVAIVTTQPSPVSKADVISNADSDIDNQDVFLDAHETLPTRKSESRKLLGIPHFVQDSESSSCITRADDADDEEDEEGDILSVCSKAAVQAEEFVHKAAEQAEEFVQKVWQAGWRVVHHSSLPTWLKDNDFLLRGHRPPTYSFLACFKSIFRIHTETGNIWSHLLGFCAFIGITVYFMSRPSIEIQWQEKAVFSAFFAGAILCMGFSWLFHTVYCHSEKVGRLFNKLDYCGIALLTIGSFVPWLYYSFYCRLEPKIVYLVLIFILGILAVVVSLWDKFSEPDYRGLRAGVFIALGLSGIVPALHFVITDGFYHAIDYASLGWLMLMAFLYIFGAVIYAVRIPERLFPGKFDIWFQSHTIFHLFVVAGAFVHYHGISNIAMYRLTNGACFEVGQ